MSRKLGQISLGLLFFLAAQSEASTSSSQTSKLDLSYLHRVKPETLADALKDALQKQSNLEIDLSSSLIGKDIKSIVSVFKDMGEDSRIDLTAQGNQWSSRDGRLLLEAALARTEKPNTEESKSDETKTESEATPATEETEATPPPSTISFPFHSLDLGWNNLGDEGTSESKKFLKALQKLVQESSASPEPFVLRLGVCALSPSACRAIGKGMISRYETDTIPEKNVEIKPLSLHLTKNEYIGDAGVAALSAAIRSIASKNKEAVVVFDILDLSACGIGDTGVEALAIALEDNPSSVRHLILSNNKITDEGAAILSRALAKANGGQRVESLDLSNNKEIGDAGARELARIIEQDSVGKLILRSCHVRADGISCFAKALKNIGKRKAGGRLPTSLEIDLSGNPIGVLRKTKKSSGYSASALKSKATATTAAYMNIIGKTVQRGLKEIGLSESQSTLESDDDEESRMNGDDTLGSSEQKETKCGALAFADAFIDEDNGEEEHNDTEESPKQKEVCKISLGLRHCALDTRAAEALASVIYEGKEKMGLNIQADVRMNNVLEDDMVKALQGDKDFESDLVDMAETHLDALERIREARRRAMEAAKAAADRMRAEAEMESAWGSAVHMGDDYDVDMGGNYDMDMGDNYDVDYDADYDEDVWDSDADYDEDMDDYY